MEDLRVPAEVVNFELVLSYNVVSKTFDLKGHAKDLLVSQGMLAYAEQFVRMEIARKRMSEELQNVPRVALAGGLPQ
jgi:hypothetical protein